MRARRHFEFDSDVNLFSNLVGIHLCLAGDTVGLRLVLVLLALLFSSLHLKQGSAEGETAGLLL